jgi:hypothetical protein
MPWRNKSVSERRNYFKDLTGIDRKVAFRRRSYKESLALIRNQSKTKYPQRLLGGGEKEIWITEEEREANMHILGQPRTGKSKFMEDQMQKDVMMGNGFCLLDPSENGDTAKKMLRFCASKGIEKVVYIDPKVCFIKDRIPLLQPIKQPPRRYQSIDALVESVNALFGVANQTDTNNIRRNLTAVLTVLARNNQTLYETKYFRNYTEAERLPFLDIDEDSQIVREAFSSQSWFQKYFITTVGRLDIFRKDPLRLMTAANSGIDFEKMIREGWVVLVNLNPNDYLSKTHARLLGILIISDIIQAMQNLFGYGDANQEGKVKKVFYLYMDEAGKFATPQISDLLSYHAKIGLRLVIAHQDFAQFKDKDVLKSIKNGCRIKMMFNVSDYNDRLEMVKDLGYGGDIPHLLAAYTNQNIPKRHMIISKPMGTPVRIRVPDVPDVIVSEPVLKDYIDKLLSYEWYLSKEEIYKQIEERHINAPNRAPRTDNKTSESRTTDDRKPNRAARVSNTGNQNDKWKDVS